MNISYKICGSYDLLELENSIREGLNLIDFEISKFSGKKVLLKPNLLGPYPPEMAVTTHPNFVEAVIRIFNFVGAKVYLGDSPGFGHKFKDVVERTGMMDVCDRTGTIPVSFEKSAARMYNGVLISGEVFNFDFIVNLPKFKAHSLALVTCAVKNLFGCVPGMQKVAYHRDFIEYSEFGRLLAKIAIEINPGLTIVDAVDVMEGDGPSAGRKISMHRIAASRDPFAIDASLCRMAGIDPMNVEFLIAAKEMGVWSPDFKFADVGDVDDVLPKGFVMPATFRRGYRDGRVMNFIMKRIWKSLSIKPKINAKRCIKCGVCFDACPVKAIVWKDRSTPPQIVKEKCVGCFCCHELCPDRAIYLKRSLLIKINDFICSQRLK